MAREAAVTINEMSATGRLLGAFNPLRWLVYPPARSRAVLLRKRIVRSSLLIFFTVTCVVAVRQYHLKRHQAVRPGVLYRTGQPTELGLWYLVRVKGVKTVLSTQLYDMRLRHGVVDPGEPNGLRESAYVAQLGAQPRQWPMGQEACWPWVTPWQFEEFYKLFDDPNNLPVAVHCAGGRHRTGTVAALFRLEYDRWSPDRALAELHSFEFGRPVPIQEHNLRTYVPRPRPSDAEWSTLAADFANVLPGGRPANYESLVGSLRERAASPALQAAIDRYLAERRAFGLCLAQRLIERPDDALVDRAIDLAAKTLEDANAAPNDWTAAASVLADFGRPEQQHRLMELIADDPRTNPPSARYQAIVAGVTNRYTPNRIPYLRPLLDDARQRPEAAASRYRYCDTAVVRLSTMVDQNLLIGAASHEDYEGGRQRARDWFAAQGDSVQLARLLPPTGDNHVLPGDPPGDGELVRNR